MNSCAPTCVLPDIDSDLLSLGVLWLTGGHDIANTPILTLPTSSHPHLEVWSAERLLQILRHYVTWLTVTSQVRCVACLADLRNASKDVITILVEAVERLEMGSRGTVSSVYFLKPANKTRSKLLKKLLGLKASKKTPKIPLFKIVLLKTHQELYNQVDLCHLTSEFGGTLTYDHATWMKFYETVAPCLREAERVRKRLPDLKDRVELLQDYDIQSNNSSVASIQHLLQELSQSFQHTLSEAGFQDTLDLLKQTLLVLDSAETSEQWLKRVDAQHVQHAAERVRQLYTLLEGQRVLLEDTWRVIEESVTVHLQIQRHRERAAEIEKRMKTHYEPLLQEHPSIGSTLSQAELYRTHFTTTLYEPSKELLSQATEILEDVQRLRERLSHVTPQCDVTDILGRLTVALQPFTHRLQSLQDVYVSVHIFHLLFQKALTWYRKVLKFIPEGLEARAEEAATAASTAAAIEDHDSEDASPVPHSAGILQMPAEWQVAVQSFLHKHPPPRDQHLARLDTEIPPQVERGLRAQARSLTLRLRLLQRMLYSRRLSAKLLSTIFKWRAEMLSGNSSSTGSTPQPNKASKHLHLCTEEASSGSSNNSNNSSSNNNSSNSNNRAGDTSGAPPPKPARLFTSMRCVNSFSSSEAGDTDNVGGNWFDQLGAEPVNHSGEADVSDASSKHPREESGDLARHHKPPKVDIKIVSAAQDSDSCKSYCLESRASDGPHSAAEQSAACRQVAENERFIRLTFTPPAVAATGSHRHRGHVDDSFDSEDLAFRYPDAQTGSESGIEVAEAEDPWDSIIDRIKAVSNSNLPSDVKIQCMSHLLSQSTRTHSPSRQRDASGFLNTSLQQLKPSQDLGVRDVAGFDQFRQHITSPQQSDIRRHQSFAIAREDARLLPRKRADPGRYEVPNRGGGGGGAASDSWRHHSGGLDPLPPRPQEPEKPASAVARMRHRLARSLMDLDEIDPQDSSEDVYKTVRFKNLKPDRRRKPTERLHVYSNSASDSSKPARSTARTTASFCLNSPRPPSQHVHFADSRQDRPWRNRARDSLSRSYEGGLDSAHLTQPPNCPSKLVAWRSHEDGLDSLERPSFLSENPLLKAGSPGSESDSATRSCNAQRVQYLASRARNGNPPRWRQGIVDDYSAWPVKERRKSQDFIAPSFLKPYHSMFNLHGNADLSSAPLTPFSESRSQRGQGHGVRGHCPEGQLGTESDSFSDGSRLGGRKSSLEILSDEMDQEYLSQDEVHSSLQRSQQILMETEDSLRLCKRRQREIMPERCYSDADDTVAPVKAPVRNQPDRSNYPSSTTTTTTTTTTTQRQNHDQDDQFVTYRAVKIQISSPQKSNGIMEGGLDASGSSNQEGVTSRNMAVVEGDCDADVSNMSDSNQDSERKQNGV